MSIGEYKETVEYHWICQIST